MVYFTKKYPEDFPTGLEILYCHYQDKKNIISSGLVKWLASEIYENSEEKDADWQK